MSEEKNIPQENSKNQIPNPKVEENKNISQPEPQPQPENMEVHKHPHHVTHKKKWGEYFLEFLMIFLAVFLGFVAENKREAVAEQKHAKEFAKSFLIDLINDTAEIDRSTSNDKLTNLAIDSLVYFTGETNIAEKGGEFYYLSYVAGWAYFTDWNKATINQLISSGSLRYFTNNQLVIKINDYNTLTNTISVLQQNIGEKRNIASPYRNQILKSKYLLPLTQFGVDDIIQNRTLPFIDSFRKTNIPLQNADPDLINNFINAILSIKGNRNILLANLYPKAKKEAAEIIQVLKKEYHLE